MIKFDDYIKVRKVEQSIDVYSKVFSEVAQITVDQAKQQIMGILQSIAMTNAEDATAKLTFLDQLMKQGAQALPELQNLYKKEYPALQQFQQQAGQQQPQQQQAAGQQAQPQQQTPPQQPVK